MESDRIRRQAWRSPPLHLRIIDTTWILAMKDNEEFIYPDSELQIETPDFEPPYPPFTGVEFLATHTTIDAHPYSVAFGQFLGNGIDPDTANLLAFGENRFDLISNDFDDPLRQRATRIYDRLEDMDYWRDSGTTDRQPENFSFGE
ncbi:hypothetical protein FDUTEX481_06324 [Tolypothrix sp. PCC 7601]|nr:hypothetical protein FDUTEX481_06324 [Tolypothrix sp. PCC 7601]BAY95977.1 hypothetical protein NIES3275_80540 [Microchaete diplosiphon NIES-3275]